MGGEGRGGREGGRGGGEGAGEWCGEGDGEGCMVGIVVEHRNTNLDPCFFASGNTESQPKEI